MSSHLRFADAPWMIGKREVTVIGAGGIGSWLIYLLAKMGVLVTVYDDDIVEMKNVGSQLHSIYNVGVNKAIAIKDMVANMIGEDNIQAFDKRFEESDVVKTPVIISAVDNMQVRSMLFEKALEHCELFIDGRMNAEIAELYSVPINKKTTIDYYKNSLFNDSEVDDGPCSYKATSHMGNILASYMVSVYNNYVVNKTCGFTMRPEIIHKTFDLTTFVENKTISR